MEVEVYPSTDVIYYELPMQGSVRVVGLVCQQNVFGVQHDLSAATLCSPEVMCVGERGSGFLNMKFQDMMAVWLFFAVPCSPSNLCIRGIAFVATFPFW